ncbi:MAG TPA: neutral/alkaline non-lysosomal ceramidase N-terminal domain-containing protein, partial [Gemmataceae bacterium]
MRRFLFALAGLILAMPLFAAEPGWQAGFAKVKITPEKLMWMSGYSARTKPAEGTEIDLWAKAAVLQAADGKKLVLVTLDLVGIDRATSQAICKRLMERHKLPREAIAIAVSHTHCGPVVGSNLATAFFLDDHQAKLVADYTAALPDKVVEAVDAAAKALEPT